MKYSIYGPYDVDRNSDLLFGDKADIKDFWGACPEGLKSALGCYIFAKKDGAKITPWYVGMTLRNFEKECFDYSKVLKYARAINNGRGKPVLFLIPKMTNTGKFVKSGRRKHSDVNFLENLLIGAAIESNPDLLNKRQTKFLREMIVPGFINASGKKTKNVQQFSSMFK